MTQQEYTDYIAHGGKWGYTNGVPNGKKKAAKKYMNSVGKYMNSVGKYVKNSVGKEMGYIGDKITERRSFEGAMDVQSKNLEKDFRQIKGNPKHYRPNAYKEPVNTEIVTLDGKTYQVDVSNRSAKEAFKKYKQLQIASKKAAKGTFTSARRFGKNQDDIKKSPGVNQVYNTLAKNKETELELILRARAGQQHKARTDAIIKKAQEADKLRYPNKKNKKKR